MSVDDDERQSLILTREDMQFLMHFVRSYQKNFACGNMLGSHHDAVAIVLCLSDILEDRGFNQENAGN